MKLRRKITVGISSAIMAMLICVGSASAAPATCNSATIKRIRVLPFIENPQTGTSKYAVQLTCDVNNVWGGNKQFIITSKQGDAAYVAILTAMSLNKKMRVRVADTTWNSLLVWMDINN